MTKKSKTIIIIIVIIVVLIGIWLIMKPSSSDQSMQNSSGQSQAQNTDNGTINDNNGLTTSPTDNSDAALNQDLNSVDGQMSGLDSDNANANQTDQGPNGQQN